MKIRIKGNSLRIRLSRSEVNKLATECYLEEHTAFGNNTLIYALQTIAKGEQLSADFIECKITMYVPVSFTQHWHKNSVVGFDSIMAVGDTGSLHLLLEKDFVCIDTTSEDQNDHYENPNKTC